MNRRLALKQLAALGALSAIGPAALAQRQPYETLGTKVPTEIPGKVEVIEFFSYGCPHCHDFEPLLDDWAKGLPADVNVVKVPITFNRPEWAALAKIYYALEAMGEAKARSAAVFEALHNDHRPLFREDVLMEWAREAGLDAKRFRDTYNSFAVNAKVKRADQIAAAYKVRGVPMMAVDGRYTLSASSAGGYDEMLKTVDALIAKARSDNKKG